MSRLNRKFFQQKTDQVAKELLGKVLVHKIGSKKISGMIVETEAYIGPHDLACHASKGKTNRTSVMFEDAGFWYVYMIYGFYYCLNIVTETKDYPSAVLIRALEPLDGIKEIKKNRKTDNVANLTSGPGKLCQALKIDKSFNATSAIAKNSKLYIEDKSIKISPRSIAKAKRIGVDYAGAWKNKLLRFYLKKNGFVSKNGL
ncbi:MAG: DNA-3-methyladenine glycosylase [Patescibacteria group bacterium]